MPDQNKALRPILLLPKEALTLGRKATSLQGKREVLLVSRWSRCTKLAKAFKVILKQKSTSK